MERLTIRSERGARLMKHLQEELGIPEGAKNVTVTYGVDSPAFAVTVDYYPTEQRVSTLASKAHEFERIER